MPTLAVPLAKRLLLWEGAENRPRSDHEVEHFMVISTAFLCWSDRRWKVRSFARAQRFVVIVKCIMWKHPKS